MFNSDGSAYDPLLIDYYNTDPDKTFFVVSNDIFLGSTERHYPPYQPMHEDIFPLPSTRACSPMIRSNSI
ncbi:hypothetical protein ATCVCan0610SP_234R [Acanthocystis turfacea Chlorella virus Can0610SP]|nr:hypothetical protein ATCVCan0610SP_234R [Acanthocystis turfacea Chlorella virus Can0610SP]